jgi:hypothetical protein
VHVTDDLTVSMPVSWASSAVSWARNGEDVVLLRALGHLTDGRFLEVRADQENGPCALQTLLDRGWAGAATALDAPDPDPADARGGPLHVVLVASDVTEADDDRVLHLAGRRPWVLIVGLHPDRDRGRLVESLAGIGYRFCMYDGVSAYFVAAEHEPDLGAALSYPACARDGFGPGAAAALLRASARREAAAVESALLWKQKAIQSWADTSTGDSTDRALRDRADDLARQLDRVQATLSWRITAPLRSVRRLRSAGPA